jgi:hypothetical protein
MAPTDPYPPVLTTVDTRFYGGQGEDRNTIHGTEFVDVETRNGKVVSVWFRCSLLKFEQHEVDAYRANEMKDAKGMPVYGIVFRED